MDVFKLRESVVDEYRRYVESFIRVQDPEIEGFVRGELQGGFLWPDAVLQLNPAFEQDKTLAELALSGLITKDTARFFGDNIRLYRHQRQAIDVATKNEPFVVTTGTGSGKSLTYLVPIYDWVARNDPGDHSVRAIIVYPMNALINSQLATLQRLQQNTPASMVRFDKFTGQESADIKNQLRDDPPHVLLTNYVMLEYILTRPSERSFLKTAVKDLQFLVMDELHFYRGRQGADVGMLLRRLQQKAGHTPLAIGTSATMASGGNRDERCQAIADVASKLLGVSTKPANIIDEALKRVAKVDVPESKDDVCKAVELPPPQATLGSVTSHPLTAWAEAAFGLARDKEGHLVRRPPVTFSDAVSRLCECSGLDRAKCETALRAVLEVGNSVEVYPGQPVFAFRLHQFVSSGSSIYTSLAAEGQRYLTMDAQYKSDKGEVLYPLAFCRDCGQEFALVALLEDGTSASLVPRTPLGGHEEESEGEVGYFVVDDEEVWADDDEELPENWFVKKNKGWQIKPEYAADRPRLYWATPDGRLSQVERVGAVKGWFQRYPLMLCPRCLAAYDRRGGEIRKLSSLSQIGRSTATTVMVNAAVSGMKEQKVIQEEAKILSFTDNRQDASLQAGHLNDFVQVALLRAGLWKALEKKGTLRSEELGDAIFEAMALTPRDFMRQPVDSGPGYNQSRDAMIDLLQYRCFEDLSRGWRVAQPNLEQTGLLKITYFGLKDLAANDNLWHGLSAIDSATAEKRLEVLNNVLDELRMNLAIDVEALKDARTKQLVERSAQWLCDPWALQKNDYLRTQGIMLLPKASQDAAEKKAGVRQLNFRSSVGRYLRNGNTWGTVQKLSVEEVEILVTGIVDRLAGQMLVKVLDHGKDHGVRLLAAALRWEKGNGKPVPVSPLRSKRGNKRRNLEEAVPNSYFKGLYETSADRLKGMVGHEHTGQIDAEARVERELSFGSGKLPALFCSPTMELGVDIKELCAVHMRNVPPTPANYAQRSGRAGRGGRPALIATFTGQGNTHDQYFFRNRGKMIAGVVEPSRLELKNKELVEAHIHSLWLSIVGLSLQRSMNDILDLKDKPSFGIRPDVRANFSTDTGKIEKATLAAARELIDKEPPLKDAWWYSEGWLESLVKACPGAFDRAFDRWRELYAAARAVIARSREVIDDPNVGSDDRDAASRTEAEALREVKLLLNDTKRFEESDFYPYRYLASEGFIPGYNFPRLPVRAFVTVGDALQSIDRPRFLAITEFGPGNVLYHEGRKYRVDGVVLPVTGLNDRLTKARICEQCGYIHDGAIAQNVDLCEHCATPLTAATQSFPQKLLEQPPVLTRATQRILSDEEERLRSGYRITTHYRFDAGVKVEKCLVRKDHSDLMEIEYAPAAEVWRINQGWRRSDGDGFVIDAKTGRWQRKDIDVDAGDDLSGSKELVSGVRTYVKDNRNVLLVKPLFKPLTREFMTTLQHAIKRGIEFVYQVEDQEISAELIGQSENRRIMLWEAAEGGTGVSEALVRDADAMPRVAAKALELCHFAPDGGDVGDRTCSVACYECLLSYANQNEHRFIDRHIVRDYLLDLATSKTEVLTRERSRDAQYEWLKDKVDPASTFELSFLDYLHKNGHKLPSFAQYQPSSEIYVQADFYYDRGKIPGVCVFVDGPTHDHPEAKEHDNQVRNSLEDRGFRLAIIRYDKTIEEQVKEQGDVFGILSI